MRTSKGNEQFLLRVPTRVYNHVQNRLKKLAFKYVESKGRVWCESRDIQWLAEEAELGNPKAQELMILIQECESVDFETIDIEKMF